MLELGSGGRAVREAFWLARSRRQLADPLLDLMLERGSISSLDGVGKWYCCQSVRDPGAGRLLSLFCRCVGALEHVSSVVEGGTDRQTDMDLTAYGDRRLSCQTHTHTTTVQIFLFHEFLVHLPPLP